MSCNKIEHQDGRQLALQHRTKSRTGSKCRFGNVLLLLARASIAHTRKDPRRSGPATNYVQFNIRVASFHLSHQPFDLLQQRKAKRASRPDHGSAFRRPTPLRQQRPRSTRCAWFWISVGARITSRGPTSSWRTRMVPGAKHHSPGTCHAFFDGRHHRQDYLVDRCLQRHD
jgi:hypothetical protein